MDRLLNSWFLWAFLGTSSPAVGVSDPSRGWTSQPSVVVVPLEIKIFDAWKMVVTRNLTSVSFAGFYEDRLPNSRCSCPVCKRLHTQQLA